MLTVETIGKVRLSLIKGESQRSVAKKYRMSRKTVKKIAENGETEFKYAEREVTYPILGPYLEQLREFLKAEEELPAKDRRTKKKIYEALQGEGYRGSYDAVRRYVRCWKEEHRPQQSAYVPLQFAKGEAFQFDWSREVVEIGGVTRSVEVAQVRLCYSRMRFCVAFFRQEAAMLMEAHIRAHDFFGGLCERGIYDNPKTVVQSIGKGKKREYNRRFVQMASHYLFEPTACTPAAGWEKGQVENQVGAVRKGVFTPRLRFASLAELNAHLEEPMILEAHNMKHPEFRERSVYAVYQEEKPYLRRQAGAFDGYSTAEHSAGSNCLVRFDNNHYSVPCEHAGKAVSVRIYAERVVVAVNGQAVADHERSFEKGRYILEPLHYLPLLSRKPGALRNGRPFLNWELPSPIRKVWDYLRRYADWDQQMSRLLLTIPTYGLDALTVACETAIEENAVSESIILNYLTRLAEDAKEKDAPVPVALSLREEPRSDCRRYDRLLRNNACCVRAS